MSVKRYEVNGTSSVFEDANGSLVDYEDYAALEARCAALAAENAGLKSIQAWAVADVFKSGAKRFESTKAAGFDTDDCLHDAVLVMLSELQTPATDAFLAEVRAQGVESLSNAVQSVISERQRQQSVEGWTPEHDDQYSKSQLLWASSCYVLNTIQPFNRMPMDWPWAPEWWKPTNPRRDLVKAGALILAEIERIDRQ